MSTVPPPAPQAPQPQPTAAQAAPTAVVREPSVELLRMAAGARVEGTVLPQPSLPPQTDAAQSAARAAAQAAQATQAAQTAVDANRADAARTGNAPVQTQTQAPPPAAPPQVQVRTPVGDITLRTPLPLPEGARVTLEVAASSNTQVSVRVTTINGQPAQQALAQLAADRAAQQSPAADPRARPVAAPAPASPAALTFGQMATPLGPIALPQAGTISAFVINGTTPLATALSAQLGAPPGQPGLGQVPPGQIPPGQTPTGQPVPGQPNTVGGTTPPAVSPPQIGLVTGSGLSIQVTAITPGAVGAASPAAQGQPGAAPPGVAGQPVTPGSAATPAAATGGTTGATTGPTPGPTITGTAATSPGQSPTSALTQQTPQGPGALLPGGGSAQSGLRLVSAQGWPQPPFTTPTQGQSSPLQLALTGTVTAVSNAGQPTVQTAAGSLQLSSAANLPVGTTVTLDVISQTLPRGDAAGSAAPPPAPGGLPFAAGMAAGATPWPTLTEALQLMQRTDPQAAQLLSNTIPDGGPRTVVAALSFMQAMRSGDPRQWPGDNNLRAIERTGPRGAHLAKTIAGEVSQLSAQSRETSGEWRSTPIPWNAEGQIEKIRLITRREETEEEKEDDESKATGLRFLLELDLSKMGEVQLDGMVREDVNGFDLIIRTHDALDEHVRRDLSGLFIASNQAVGLKGGLTFQVTPKFPDPIAQSEPLKQQKDGVWV